MRCLTAQLESKTQFSNAVDDVCIISSNIVVHYFLGIVFVAVSITFEHLFIFSTL